MKYPYPLVVEWSEEDGCFLGSAPPLIGHCCHGKTEQEVVRQLKQITAEWQTLLKKQNVVLPPSFNAKKFSGRFVLRLNPHLHRQLAIEAFKEGKSLNEICANKLLKSST